MDNRLVVHCISLLILLHNTESHSTNDSDSLLDDALRVPRVSGRIVKVYSGTRPDPVHCTGEGFQGDPTNCAVFYRCMKSGNGKFTVFRFQCGPGTVYDPDTEVCNHPRSTRRKECGGIVDSSYNDQTHINEIDNAPVEIPSPIVTKQPVYTESASASKPIKPNRLSTQDSTISTVSLWSSLSERSTKNDFTRTTIPPYRTSTVAQSYNKRTAYPNHPHQPTSQSTQTSRQPSSPNDDTCTSDGFMGDSKNCRKFYRCVSDQRGGYTKYDFLCSESTKWDDDIQSCNHPWAVKRSRCGRSSINNNYIVASVFKSTTNTTNQQQLKTTSQPKQTKKEHSSNNKVSSSSSQQQTQISYGSKVTQIQTQISNGPVTQNQTQINYSDLVNQTMPYGVKQNQTQIINESAISQVQTQISHGEKGMQSQLQIDHSNQSSQMQVQINEISTKLPTTFQYYNNEEETHTTHLNNNNNNKCTESGFMGDDNDCKKFYRCVDNGRKSFTMYEFSCGEGTVWDAKIEACNHAWAVKECGGKVGSEIVAQTTEPSTTKSTQSYYTTPTKSTQNSIISSSTIVLDIDEEINDDSGYGNHIQQHSTTYSTIINETTPKPSNHEGNDCKSSGFYGDVNNCKKFYRCVDNGKGSFTKYEFQCGEGTVWDPDIEACNHAWAVKKCGGTGSNIDKVDSTTNSVTMDVTSQVINTASTQTTTQTNHQNDEYDNGYNNDEIPQITSSTTNKPQNQDTTDNTCISSGFMGDSNDCKKFYRCVDNGDGTYMRYEFSCGEGTIWDPKIEACNHPWAVEKCGGNGSIPAYNETTSESSSTIVYEEIEGGYPTQSDKNTEFPTQSTSTIKSTTVAIDIENNNCKKSGFMGDNNDCKKFYRCVDNGDGTYMRYEFSCGEGTVWDPKIEACNHPWAVEKCGGSGSSPPHNETSSESSSTIGYEEIEGGYPTQSDKNTDIPTQSTSTIMSTTGVTDIENNNCKKSGFMGDNNDCKKFYRCVDNGDGTYVRYEFSCGEGTVWDSKIEACNHAWAVEKCGSVSETTNVNLITSSENPIWSDEEINNAYPSQNDEELDKTTSNSIFESTTMSNTIGICKNSGFIGDKYDCKKFYRCVDDGKGSFIKYEFSCGEGTAWDQSIESCNHAGSVQNCGTSMNQSTPIHYESTTQNLPTTISEIGSNGYYPQATGESSTIGQPQSDVSNICTKEGFVGDKNDCKKFYRCVDNNSGGFIQYNFVCGEGTVWVQYIQACDHATSDQPCGSSINEISKEPSHENDEMYPDTSIKTSTTSSTQVSFGSTPASENPQTSNFVCKSEGFFGDTKDCMKFYRCVDNGKESFTKYDFICGEGTFWDQDIQACNHITESKNCTKSQTSSTSLATDSNIEPSTTPIITEQQSSTEKSETSTSSTDDKCISEGFFPNSNDCSKFFRCVSDGKGGYIKYEFSCGEGTVWVQDIQACDYDDNIATCDKQNGSTKPQTTEVYQSSTQASDLLISTSSESQTPGKQDDEYPENEPVSSGQCLTEGFYADNSDCKRFYRCIDDGHGGFTKYDFVCGEGTAWDENIQGCNHISEVKSCQDSIQETHTQSVLQDEEISQPTEGTSTTKKASSESSDSTATIAGNNKCEKEGYFGNTEDCKQFYRCVDNGNGGLTKYEFTCGEGTIWDQDITTCNHPEDVTNPSCKQKEPSSTSSSSSSTSSQSSTSTTESSNLNSNNCSHEQTSKEPVHKNITCDQAGYYGDPNDCKKFYRCVDWDGDGKRFSVYHFDCGEGTIWDPALETCNHEESVYPPRNCSGTQSQNEIITDDTTTSTQEDTTTEQSTTQRPSSTTEQLTTQQTSASEQTTTQQSTTSEQTTTQQTGTSEQTTTQQSTTSEQTTTQQSTASEQTTTQQSTTSEQTTTQQSTSSEQTTTQQATTSEQTTTQETTSREPTTTQQSTISEQTTTQETTSSELTTTQQSTASETTTTQQSTTSEQATTQQTTSSEQTTTQQSTTTQETTTTEQSTSTQQSTNSEQTTTEQTTTNESTTQQSTTNENTTEELISSEQTTEGTTTEPQTSQASTTESSSTEQSSSTTEQSNEGTTTTEGKQETSTEEGSSSKECPDTEDNQYLYVCPTSFRRHPKYCNLFYQCIEDDDNYDNKIAVFTCPNNTIYDESKTQCVAEEKSDKKCDGEIAQRRRFKRLDGNMKEPIVVGVEKQSCQTVGNLPFEKKYECSPAFLKCKKNKSGALRGFVYKCPEGYIYWSISRRCELIGNLSDCKRSNNNWDKRWEIPVEKTNIDSYKYKLIRTSSNNMH